MGTNKRAVERERLMRASLPETHKVRLRWRRHGDALPLNVLDPINGAPLTRERSARAPKAIAEMVDRTVCPPGHGPRGLLYRKALDEGRGELDVEITPDRFIALAMPGVSVRVTRLHLAATTLCARGAKQEVCSQT